jgi:hypothetical protein
MNLHFSALSLDLKLDSVHIIIFSLIEIGAVYNIFIKIDHFLSLTLTVKKSIQIFD